MAQPMYLIIDLYCNDKTYGVIISSNWCKDKKCYYPPDSFTKLQFEKCLSKHEWPSDRWALYDMKVRGEYEKLDVAKNKLDLALQSGSEIQSDREIYGAGKRRKVRSRHVNEDYVEDYGSSDCEDSSPNDSQSNIRRKEFSNSTTTIPRAPDCVNVFPVPNEIRHTRPNVDYGSGFQQKPLSPRLMVPRVELERMPSLRQLMDNEAEPLHQSPPLSNDSGFEIRQVSPSRPANNRVAVRQSRPPLSPVNRCARREPMPLFRQADNCETEPEQLQSPQSPSNHGAGRERIPPFRPIDNRGAEHEEILSPPSPSREAERGQLSPSWTADSHGTGREQVRPPRLPVNQGAGHEHLPPFRPSGSRVSEPEQMRRNRSLIIREAEREQMPQSRPFDNHGTEREERRQPPPSDSHVTENEQFRQPRHLRGQGDAVDEILNMLRQQQRQINVLVNGGGLHQPLEENHALSEVLPLQSVNELEDFEKQLQNDNVRKNLVDFIRFEGGATAKEAIERALRAIFKNCLAQHINWEGNLKLGVRKQKFEGSRIQKILFATIKSTNAFSKTDKHKMTGYVKNWLRHAPARAKTDARRAERN